MEISRWLATVAGIWIQCSSGASYAFGIYSPVLKSSQGYSQSTLDMISVFKDIGANAGVISGLLYSSVARRRGPWIVHVAGAVQCFLGYFMIWLAVEGMIKRPPVPLMCLFMLVAAHAQTFFNTADVVTAVHNFPNYSGTIVGIMKGFLGLSGAVLIQVYKTFLRGKPSSFILMMAIFPTTASLLFMFFIRIYHAENKGEADKKHLNRFSVVALIIAAYLLLLIILENLISFPFYACILTLTLLMVLLFSPLVLALEAQKEETKKLVPVEMVQKPDVEQLSAGNCSPSDDSLQLHKDMNFLQSVSTLDFWFLFLAMICGMGSGLATINNISQIGQSLRYKTVQINTLVSLWSIWNFLGRFGAGYISDIFLYKYGWGRPLMMAITLATMSIGHITIASGFSGNLYIGSVLVGICYGSQWSLMPTITSEIFGVTHMGTIFNAIAVASPVGSFIWSVLVIGHMYDKQASGKGKTCYGEKCFMLSFFLLACVSLLGFLAATVLFFRTRKFYKGLVARRKRDLARG